jgi:hypothetical protein
MKSALILLMHGANMKKVVLFVYVGNMEYYTSLFINNTYVFKVLDSTFVSFNCTLF